MGIRFSCPNGHQLHVKAFQAGKKGICPHCGARFRIPSIEAAEIRPSKGSQRLGVLEAPDSPPPNRASSAAGFRAGPLPQIEPLHDSRSPEPPSPRSMPNATAWNDSGGSRRPSLGEANAPAPVEPGPASIWYVQHPIDGQFGPISDATIQEWRETGRIPAEAWVWRVGWPDWKLAAEVWQEASLRPPPRSPGMPFAFADPAADDDIDDSMIVREEASTPPLDTEMTTAAIPSSSRAARKKAQTKWVVIALSVVSFLLFIALLFVLANVG